MGDFDNLKPEEVVVNGAPLAVPAEPAEVVEPAAPAEPAAPENTASSGEPTPPKEVDVDLSKAELKFNNPSFKDDFIKGVVDYYEKTGDLTPYLQAKTVDFTGMSDEEIMRRSLREQYPDVSEKAFERLYKQQVVDKFKLDADEYGEEDFELGRELLKAEASKSRQKYIEWQQTFKAPEPVASQDEANQQAMLQEQLRAFEESVKTNDVTKSILTDKRIVIKAGEGEFNYELPNPESLVDMTLDNNKFFAQFAGPDGKVDYSRWYKAVAYSQNPEQFEKSLVNYGKTLGREELTKELKNPSNNTIGDIPTEDAVDFKTGLLQAFASRGIKK